MGEKAPDHESLLTDNSFTAALAKGLWRRHRA